MSGSETGSEEIGGIQQGGGGGGFHSGGGGGGNAMRPNEGNVATRAICIENKRFYMDVKENSRGRFIKISELSLEGRRNQIVMAMPIASMFQKILRNMISEYTYLGPLNLDRLTLGELSSEVIHSDEKRYRVDLKENVRGRFLKVSETFVQGKSRFQIAIPANGMAEFDEHLSDLIEEHGELEDGGGGSSSATVESNPQQQQASPGGPQGGGGGSGSSHVRKIQIDNKTFTFDFRKVPQSIGGGKVISICESRGNFKKAIEIPESGWDSFREMFNEYIQECQEAAAASSSH